MSTSSTATQETRRRGRERDPNARRNVAIHPELYKMLVHEKAETGEAVYERAHFYLCTAMERLDLLHQPPDDSDSN